MANLKLEELIGIQYEIGNILLLDHKEEPEVIDIINVRDHVTLNEKVIKEPHCLFKNLVSFDLLTTFSTQSYKTYTLL